MGKLIVIEGVDGSGKETQSDILYKKLKDEGLNVIKISFPNYKSKSSSLVKMYLKGDFGDKPNDVSAYVASSFFAVDRYATYQTEWKEFYEKGGIVIADRYTTANMLHQASKIKDIKKADEFLDWLYNLEFNMYKIPVPDKVIFLDMPPELSIEITKKRKNKITGLVEKDIHEKDKNHIFTSYQISNYVSEKYGWIKVKSAEKGELKSIKEISLDIYEKIKDVL